MFVTLKLNASAKSYYLRLWQGGGRGVETFWESNKNIIWDGNTKRRGGIAGSKAWLIKGLVFDGASKEGEMNARTSRRLAINQNSVIDLVIDTCDGSAATLGTVDGRKVHARMQSPVAFVITLCLTLAMEVWWSWKCCLSWDSHPFIYRLSYRKMHRP